MLPGQAPTHTHPHVCAYTIHMCVCCNWLMQDVHKLVKNIFALANLVMVSEGDADWSWVWCMLQVRRVWDL